MATRPKRTINKSVTIGDAGGRPKKVVSRKRTTVTGKDFKAATAKKVAQRKPTVKKRTRTKAWPTKAY